MPFANTPTGTAAANAALDALVATFPSPGTYRLYSDAPATTELPADGGTARSWGIANAAGAVVYWDLLPQPKALSSYASAPHSTADWAPAGDVSKTTTAPVPIGDGFYPTLYWRDDN